MTKRLIFSDIHFHPYAYGSGITEEGFNTRLWAQWEAAQEMIEDVDRFEIEYAYFCGDLFHTHGSIPTQALAIAQEMFRQLRMRGVKIRAIPGNHDMLDRHGKIHGLLWLPEDEIYGQWEDGGVLVSALPYTTDEEVLKRFLGDCGDGDGGMVLLHQGVAGVPLASGFVPDERLTPDMIPDNCRAFTGHYHFHRAVTPNLTVVGNLTPLNWGDVDQSKGWVIWDGATGHLEQRLQSKAPGFWNYSYEDDISLVEGQFIRYTSPVTTKEIADVRADLIKEGALTVEFPNVTGKDKKQAEALKSGEEVTIAHIVKVLEDRDKGRRKEVGVEIREESYHAPEA